jgi:hypothetical protein
MMATRALMLVLSVFGGALVPACDPDQPCDPGYYADHGLCLRVLGTPNADADGGSDDAGPGAGFANDDSDFGRPCAVAEDCGGKAPECAAPMLPLCTAVNCLQGESQCPATWTCLDISSWERPYPEIKSICIQFD